jgi:hypothetical protein
MKKELAADNKNCKSIIVKHLFEKSKQKGTHQMRKERTLIFVLKTVFIPLNFIVLFSLCNCASTSKNMYKNLCNVREKGNLSPEIINKYIKITTFDTSNLKYIHNVGLIGPCVIFQYTPSQKMDWGLPQGGLFAGAQGYADKLLNEYEVKLRKITTESIPKERESLDSTQKVIASYLDNKIKVICMSEKEWLINSKDTIGAPISTYNFIAESPQRIVFIGTDQLQSGEYRNRLMRYQTQNNLDAILCTIVVPYIGTASPWTMKLHPDAMFISTSALMVYDAIENKILYYSILQNMERTEEKAGDFNDAFRAYPNIISQIGKMVTPLVLTLFDKFVIDKASLPNEYRKPAAKEEDEIVQ